MNDEQYLVWSNANRAWWRSNSGGYTTDVRSAEAQEIRDIKGLEPILDTATRFSISESNVRLIQAGKTWRKDRQDRHIFTREEILRIRSAPQADGVTKGFAKEFGMSLASIQRIRNGTFYKHITPDTDDRRLFADRLPGVGES